MRGVVVGSLLVIACTQPTPESEPIWLTRFAQPPIDGAQALRGLRDGNARDAAQVRKWLQGEDPVLARSVLRVLPKEGGARVLVESLRLLPASIEEDVWEAALRMRDRAATLVVGRELATRVLRDSHRYAILSRVCSLDPMGSECAAVAETRQRKCETPRRMRQLGFELHRDARDAKVVWVCGESPADRAGLEVDDVIRRVNDRATETGTAAAMEIEFAIRSPPVVLAVERKSGVHRLQIDSRRWSSTTSHRGTTGSGSRSGSTQP